jgi:Cell Wall Hydrolase
MVSFAARAAYAPQTLEEPLSIIPHSLVEQLMSEAERLGIEPAIAVPLMQRGVMEPLQDVASLLSADDPIALPPSSFRQSLAYAQPVAGRFSGRFAADGSVTPHSDADSTGTASGGASPEMLYQLTLTSPDGTTPKGGRAVELASMTPAPLEPEILAMPSIAVAIGPAPDEVVANVETDADITAGDPDLADTTDDDAVAFLPGQPNYAKLISPKAAKRELKCLAEAIYFEARSESEAGQIAVAQVVLNRVKSPLYPNTICGVVYQNSHRHLACQFTFTCEGKKLRITEPGPWRQAVRLSKAVLGGEAYDKEVAGATHYHATYVKPRWAKKLRRMEKIGTHIFYKLRPGQT